ncbi:MAG: HDOD domain-containing protein [Rhodanobacter sp.]|nr:MAG: HDOD domain-containing protein [Rhodanobacter sp.]
MGSLWEHLFHRRRATANRVRPGAVTAAAGLRHQPDTDTIDTDAPRQIMPLAEIEDCFHRFVLSLPDATTEEPGNAELALLKRLRLLSVRFDTRNLPRLPSVLPQLLRTLRNDNAAGKQLSMLIGRDPLMVGEVMRVTSSVYYRSAQPVRSLQHAVILLGQNGLRRVLTHHVMKPILQANAGTLSHLAGERLWDHAERCAHVCAVLGRNSGCDSFEAYLAGIICHSGTGAVIRMLGQLIPPDEMTFSSGFLAACAQLAAQLSMQAAQYWELPQHVIEALTERQHPDKTASLSPLGTALTGADLLAIVQLLDEHRRLPEDLDLSPYWPDAYTPSLLHRCQLDLRRQFGAGREHLT